MNITTKPTPSTTPTTPPTDKNNDKFANYIFHSMTITVFIGSVYLYFHLDDYMNLIRKKNPTYNYPSIKDIAYSIIFIPILKHHTR
jgi:hypothetical protein